MCGFACLVRLGYGGQRCNAMEDAVQFNEGARLDPSQMASGGGGGGRVAVGGGVGIVVLIVAMLFGINPSELASLTGGSSGATAENPGTDYSVCQTGADIAKNQQCRFVAYTNSVQAYWGGLLGAKYTPAKTATFSGQTTTGCGAATTDVGPFYCSADKTVYLDTTFFDQMLKGQLGAEGGNAAEAYVIAHEYGHHIQDITGTLAQVQQAGNSTGADSGQVALELQADCYAGVWLAHATSDANSPIASLTQDDLNRAQDAARSVGDDRIQKKMQGTVNPDSWTHGSSAMRQHWLAEGFNTGDPNQCNTFGSGS
jgi:predicted metalloprotease